MSAESSAPVTPYPLTPLEIATGDVIGPDVQVEYPEVPPGVQPRRVLEEVIAEALKRPPCLVSFSGGRDSSAILAVAARVARHEGLPLPVPMTLRFTDAPDTEESEWQELVVEHLQLPDWERRVFTAELDVIGPVAGPLLRRHGLLWPAQFHFLVPVLEAAAGGIVLTGEGGDELFRLSKLARIFRVESWRREHFWPLARVAAAALPRPVRRAIVRRLYASERHRDWGPWLRPAARAEYIDHMVRVYLSEPMAFGRFVRHHGRSRAFAAWESSLRVVASETGARAMHPFFAPGFLAALGSWGGWRGRGDRRQVMTRLFGDVLPVEVIQRTTKAEFSYAFFGPYSRAFVRAWDGSGVEESLVDVGVLRDIWLSPHPDPWTKCLLQSAWLAGEGHADARRRS